MAGGVDGVSVASGVTSDTVTAAQPPSPATAAGGAAPAAAPEIDQRELDRTGSTSSSSGGEQEVCVIFCSWSVAVLHTSLPAGSAVLSLQMTFQITIRSEFNFG